jgi:hypothetical protein
MRTIIAIYTSPFAIYQNIFLDALGGLAIAIEFADKIT